jgi:hypothetical protein
MGHSSLFKSQTRVILLSKNCKHTQRERERERVKAETAGKLDQEPWFGFPLCGVKALIRLHVSVPIVFVAVV